MGSNPSDASAPVDSIDISYLVVDAEPVHWSLEATCVLEILTKSGWSGSLLNLDRLLEQGSLCSEAASRVVLVQASVGKFALYTRHALHLEVFKSADLLSLPDLIFGVTSRLCAAKQVVLAKGARPVIVLDVDTLHQAAIIVDKGKVPQLTEGELEL